MAWLCSHVSALGSKKKKQRQMDMLKPPNKQRLPQYQWKHRNM